MQRTTLRSLKMRCPLCEKRVFDISELPGEQIAITLKCPSCHRVVTVRCAREAVFRLKASPITKNDIRPQKQPQRRKDP